MSTLSFHVDSVLEKRIRQEAKKRKLPLSRFLKESVAESLERPGVKGFELRGILSGKGSLKPEDKGLPPWNDSDPLLS